MARPYFDSNVFIDLMEGEDELALPLQAVLLRLRDRGVRVVASELVLAEVLVKARLNGGAPLYRKYLDLLVFSGTIDLQPVSRDLLYSVADYRELTGAKVPDAIHVVTAVRCACPIILTRDDRMKLPADLIQIRSSDPHLPDLVDSHLK